MLANYMYYRRTRAVVLTVLLLVVLGGCQKAVIRTPAPAPPHTAQGALAAKAERAYTQGDYAKAQRLYDQLLQFPELEQQTKRQAWKHYALSAIARGKYHTGLEALEYWRAEAPEADTTAAWQEAWTTGVRNIPATKAIEVSKIVVGDAARPWPLRAQAALLLASRQWESDASEAMQTLTSIYAAAENTDWRPLLEKQFLELLTAADASTLKGLARELTAENETRFPYAAILLEKARRAATDAQSWPQAWQALQRLRIYQAFADSALVDSVLAPLQEQFGSPASGIALALPLTGPYGNIGWKILRGAGLAQWEAAKQGHTLSVRIINTEAAGWEAELAQLPEGYTIVGGPLRKQIFERISRTGMLDERTFFTFLSSLEHAREGRDAWRFFSSPHDQLRSLLTFTRQLGVSSASTLYPDEAFGYRMRDMFSKATEELDIANVTPTSYAPKDTTGWGSVLKTYLEVPAPQPGMDDSLPPTPPFQAVFLPDGWKTMELLIPHFFFFQEDRMIFLGSSLWEQGLAAKQKVDSRYYNLAVFPGAWNPFTPTPAAQTLSAQLEQSGLGRADIWVGIGYDFVRFATGLGKISAGESSSSVNQKIAAAQQMDWSIAPIVWDADGLAAQDMFLFTPSAKGFAPVDKEAFKRRVQRTRERHYLRVETQKIEWNKKQAQKNGTPYTGPQEATLPKDFPTILSAE